MSQPITFRDGGDALKEASASNPFPVAGAIDVSKTGGQTVQQGVVTPTTTLTGVQNVLPEAIYNATPTTRTEGQGGPLQCDDEGKLLINQGNVADDSAFTPGTTNVTPFGALADETSPDSVDEGDAGALRMTLDRKLYVMPAPDHAPMFDSDADNSAQAMKAAAGRLYSLDVINPNSTPAYIQLFNTAAGSVTVGTTAPVYVVYVPASGSVTKEFYGMYFSTAITYAATTTATGSGDPTTGLTLSASYL